MSSRALFLDRDGTLIESRHYLSDPSEVVLMPGVREALHRFITEGYRLFLFTNQSGVGRGFFPLEAVHRCNERMLELLDLPPPRFTEVCIATETPEMPAVYRKPSPRFIHEMMEKYALNPAETWMVGDMPCDVGAGLNAGVRTAMIKADRTAEVPAGVWRCRDWPHFERKVLSESGDPVLPPSARA